MSKYARKHLSYPPSPLESVRACRHPDVVCKFCEIFAISQDEAQKIFGDLLTWLWLRAQARCDYEAGKLAAPIRFVVIPPSLILDEMWHVFLLFTADYAEFCETFLGGLIAHEPKVVTGRDGLQFDLVLETAKARLRRELLYAGEVVGQDWLHRLYVELPALYPYEKIASLHHYSRFGAAQSQASKA